MQLLIESGKKNAMTLSAMQVICHNSAEDPASTQYMISDGENAGVGIKGP